MRWKGHVALCAAFSGMKKHEQALESSSFFQSPSDEENVPRSASEVQDNIWHEISLIKNSKTPELFKAKNINICSFYPRNFDLTGLQHVSGPSAHFSTTLPSFLGNLKEIKCEESTF